MTSEPNHKIQALHYSEQGLHVFPVHWIRTDAHCSCGKHDCHAPGKHPITKKGCLDATTDTTQIRKWWEANPSANIGIATGAASGLYVIDAEQEGVQQFEREFPDLECPTVLTGGGGQHYWYKFPVNQTLKNAAKLHGMAVDARGEGGYVLAPPSNHLSGNFYSWSRPVDGTLPELPAELLAWVLSAKPASKPLTFVGDLDECPGVSEGSRNERLAEYVGRHLAYGEPVTTILEKAISWGERCTPALAESEVFRTVQSIEQKHHQESAPECENDDAQDQKQDRSSKREKSQAAKLVELCHGIELFHSPDGTAYASFEIDDHRECWPIRCKSFKTWLAKQYWKEYQSVPSNQAKEDALSTLEGFAVHEGDEERVHVRIAAVHDASDTDDANDTEKTTSSYVIDLGTPDWKCVIINQDGWVISETSPVRFRRPRGMRPLPIPRRGGDVNLLKGFLNVREEDWPLLAGWLLGALNANGPFPVLALYGEAGSGKSTLTRALKMFVDPNEAPLRRQPRDDQDLIISANNSWLLAYDNISRVHNGLSDCLCRLSTGGGFSTRTFYTNDEETIFNVMRPAIINGIEDLASRGDLMVRLVPVTLERIAEVDRLSEREYWQELERYAPLIFGALLDAVSQAIRQLPTTNLPTLPRIADFALWVTAGETALGLEEGEFLTAYERAHQNANVTIIESSPVARAIGRLIDQEQKWVGTSAELLYKLEEYSTERDRKDKRWPNDATRMSGQLRRVATTLRETGIEVEFLNREAGRRTIVIHKQDKVGETASLASSVSPDDQMPGISQAKHHDTDCSHPRLSVTNSVTHTESKELNDADDTNDTEFPASSQNGFKFVC